MRVNSKTGKSPRWRLGVSLLGVACFFGGCATTKQVYEDQIAGLEREVLQLKAERTNLTARLGGLDDKLLLYEKRAERCSESQRERSLEVVRLSPDDPSAGELADEPDDDGLEEVPPEDGERPILTLVGRSSYPMSARPATTSASAQLVGGGDNLGVVQMDTGSSEESGPGATDGPMAEFQEAYRAYTNGAFDEALVRFARFLAQNPGHSFADNAMFWRGEAYLSQGKLLKAIGEFERLVRRYPSSEKRPSALYRIGFAYDSLGDRARAKEYYFKVVDRHPGTDAARKASRRVAAIREAGGQSASLLPVSAER